MSDFLDINYLEHNNALELAIKNNRDEIYTTVELIINCLTRDNKLLLCGNGGSAADSQHIAAEFIGRFKNERRALPAIALTTDTSTLTALGNDYSFDIIFGRQVDALGKRGDIVLGFSTSGNSENVIVAMQQAKDLGLRTISFTGHSGGRLAPITDLNINVPSITTARIQEAHIFIAHCICELVEKEMLQNE